jgi:hypothetical protein
MLDLFDLLDVCRGKIEVSTTFFFSPPFVSLWWKVIEVLSHHVHQECCLTDRMHNQNLHDCWHKKKSVPTLLWKLEITMVEHDIGNGVDDT